MWIAAFLLALSTHAFCDEPLSVEQGAADYDWQTCINAKTSDCADGCANSEEIDCNANCEALAKDKCQSEGLSPPS